MHQPSADIETQIYDLVARTSTPDLVGALRRFARELLDDGYDREYLYRDMLGVYKSLEDEAKEDALADVMDYLTGFCSPAARL